MTYEIFDINKKKKNNLHRIIYFSHHSLSRFLKRRNINIFIDGTFKCVPKQFYQCLILIVEDDETDLFIPVSFFLVDTKESWAIWHFLNMSLQLSNCTLKPKSIMTDYEKGLVKTIKEFFPKSQIFGCLFHWKQALRRKLLKLKINEKSVHIAMKSGCLDLLSIINKKDIPTAINYLKTIIPINEESEKWNEFFIYFNKIWINEDYFEMWNNFKVTVYQMTRTPVINFFFILI